MATGLGRGLNSLIPDKSKKTNNADSSELPSAGTAVNTGQLKVGVDEILVNSMQPRKKFTDSQLQELADSIKEYGVIQPLVVIKKDKGYELIAGERRWRASKMAGLEKVPVVLREADQEKKLALALIENIQRENLNPIDLGHAYRRLMDDFGLNQEQVAKKVGKARSSITNTVRMISLPEEIQLALIDGRLTEAHAKYLLGLDSEVKQLNLFRRIMHNNLSVRETTQHARRMGGTRQAKIKINYRDKDKEFKLREFFGAKASIKRKQAGGQVIINFYSDDELDEIVEKIS